MVLYLIVRFSLLITDLKNDVTIKNECDEASAFFDDRSCLIIGIDFTFDVMFLCGGMINFFIWLVTYLAYVHSHEEWKRTIKNGQLESDALQRTITEKTLEVDDLWKQLRNGRSVRGSTRTEDSPPLHTEQENETTSLLTITRFSD